MRVWDADLVVASTGEDKKISLWRKNGQSLGTVPATGKDGGDSAEVNSFLFSLVILRSMSCFISYRVHSLFLLAIKYILINGGRRISV